MKKEYKIGDRVLIKKLFSNPYHADIFAIKNGLFGKKYYASYGVHDHDYNEHYRTTGTFRDWNIID